jgi:tRNA A-37 threonylcarbamoyl transferase component Bud32
VKWPEYVERRSGGVTWRVQRAWAHLVDGGVLADVRRTAAAARVLKAHRFKSLLELTDAPGSQPLLIKGYAESGPIRRLKAALRGARALRELEACRRVVERDIPCAPILAAGVGRGRSWVVARRLMGWERLDRLYGSAAVTRGARARLALAYGRFCRRIHDAGVHQYDLNPTNVLARLIGAEPEFLLIDFERVTFTRSVPLAVRLDALGRMDRIGGVARTDRLRFLAGYAREQTDRRARREWTRRIVAVRERSLRERERKLARACVREGRGFGAFRQGRLRGFYRKADPETGQGGIDAETLRDLAVESGRARVGWRLRHVEGARRRWVQDCVRHRQGLTSQMPLAVLWVRGSRRGFIVYG